MVELPRAVRAHLRGHKIAPRKSAVLASAQAVFPFFPANSRFNVSEKPFLAWVAAADYAKAGPDWWAQFGAIHLRKMLWHWVSVQLVGVKKGGVYLDAGASVSPFFQVIRRTHGAKLCYRQDLNRTPGLRGDGIGSDAAAIPLPDASLDGIVAHDAWEHFEGASAIGFLTECARLLKPGAKVCILPLSLAERTEVWTSPSCWATKYRLHPAFPLFDERAAVVIDESLKQRQILLWNPADLAQALAGVMGMAFEMVQVVHEGKADFALVGTRR